MRMHSRPHTRTVCMTFAFSVSPSMRVFIGRGRLNGILGRRKSDVRHRDIRLSFDEPVEIAETYALPFDRELCPAVIPVGRPLGRDRTAQASRARRAAIAAPTTPRKKMHRSVDFAAPGSTRYRGSRHADALPAASPSRPSKT